MKKEGVTVDAVVFEVTTSFETFLLQCNGEEVTQGLNQQICIADTDYQENITYDIITNKYTPCTKYHIDYLNQLRHGRPIKLARAKSIFFICWQWGNLNEMFFPCIEINSNHFLLYCYDEYWLGQMPIFTRLDNSLYILSANISLVSETLPGTLIMIGGWGNPSHFFGQYFCRYHLLEINPLINRSGKKVIFKMPSWQEDLIATCFTYKPEDFHCINLADYTPANGKFLLLRTEECFIFEDIPQWLGFQHARSYMRNRIHNNTAYGRLSTVNYASDMIHSRYYLSRSKHEILSRIRPEERRIIDHVEVAKLLHKYNFTILFPEDHDILTIQRLLSTCDTVVVDPGSCNIHALLSPVSPIIIALGNASIFQVPSHPSLRHIEWFNAQLGKNLLFCSSHLANCDEGRVNTYCSLLEEIISTYCLT